MPLHEHPRSRNTPSPAGGLHHDPQPQLVTIDLDDVEPGQIDQQVALEAILTRGTAADSRTRH